MNWFERYGIVGMFFIVMTGMWYVCLFPRAFVLLDSIKPEHLKFIGGLFGLSFLPFGYIIMIFSQRCYYLRKGIHRQYWQWLLGKHKHIIDKISDTEKKKYLDAINPNNEAQLEAILTYYDRKYSSSPENNEFISRFATKRFDVISINNGLICAIILSFIAAFCLKWIIFGVSLEWIKSIPFSVYFVSIFAILIIIVLYLSSQIQEKQIFEIGKRKFTDMQGTDILVYEK